jgi:hypothetical protein
MIEIESGYVRGIKVLKKKSVYEGVSIISGTGADICTTVSVTRCNGR